MGQVCKPAGDNQPLNINSKISIDCILLPSFRTLHAIENRVHQRFLVKATGGLGDQICAEPAIRYAINHFRETRVAVESITPELFQHLPLLGNYTEPAPQELRERFFNFTSMYAPDHLSWEFLCHMIVHCVDFCALNMWRMTLPIADKNVILIPNEEQKKAAEVIHPEKDVVLHCGKNWQSKTIPISFWNEVLSKLKKEGFRPVLIGAPTVLDPVGTSDVDSNDCLDLRSRHTPMETVAVCQRARVVLTNDSAPLHMAVTGNAWVGLITTVKHPDYITHWRNNGSENEYGWRMKNFSSGGMWQYLDLAPNNTKEVIFNKVDPDLLASWLPNPIHYAEWAIERMSEL